MLVRDAIAPGGLDTGVPMLKDVGIGGLGGAGDAKIAAAVEAAGLRYFCGYLTPKFTDALLKQKRFTAQRLALCERAGQARGLPGDFVATCDEPWGGFLGVLGRLLVAFFDGFAAHWWGPLCGFGVCDF